MFFQIRFEAPMVDSVASKMVNSEQLPSLTVKNSMSNGKMKGLLKGLRYISQIFESEKEPEMQIGFPTDVKHVAHIGWEGPSVNSPSWMNEFSSNPALSSPTLSAGDSDSGRLGLRSPNFPGNQLKTSMRQTSSGGAIDSPAKEKSGKSKSRRSSRAKDSSNNNNKMHRKPMDPNQGSDSPTLKHSNTPKKSWRKKSKDSSSVGGSTRSRSRAQTL